MEKKDDPLCYAFLFIASFDYEREALNVFVGDYKRQVYCLEEKHLHFSIIARKQFCQDVSETAVSGIY